MDLPLFGEEKFRVVLWHKQQKRVVLEPTRELTEAEMKKANQYYIDSLCPDLVYRRKSEIVEV